MGQETRDRNIRRAARRAAAIVTTIAAIAVTASACATGRDLAASDSPLGHDPYRMQADHGCPPADEIASIVGDTVQLTTQDNDPIVCTYEQPALDVSGVARFSVAAGMTLDDYVANWTQQRPEADIEDITINGTKGVLIQGVVAMPWGGGVMEVTVGGFDHAPMPEADLARMLAERYGEKIIADMKG